MKFKNPLERYLYKKLIDRPQIRSGVGENNDSVSSTLVEELNRIQRSALTKASLAGAMAVIVLFVPYYIWGSQLFPITEVWIPILEEVYPIEISFLIYSMVLLLIEIAFLTYNNIQTVKKIAYVSDFPDKEDPFYNINIQSLIAVGLEKSVKEQTKIGIDPYTGLSKWKITLFTVVNLAKAAATNFLFKLLVKKLLGRVALRFFVDLVGIPVYAFWNAYAARFVYRETRIRINASATILSFSKQLYESQKDNPEFKENLYYMLDFVAITKRKFHSNHYILAVTLLKDFGIAPDPNHKYDHVFLERMENASPETIDGFSKINLMGMILDGQISKKEELLIYQWRKKGFYKYTTKETKAFSNQLYNGAKFLKLN